MSSIDNMPVCTDVNKLSTSVHDVPICSDDVLVCSNVPVNDSDEVFDDTMNGPAVLSDHDTPTTEVKEEGSVAPITDDESDSTHSAEEELPSGLVRDNIEHYRWQQSINQGKLAKLCDDIIEMQDGYEVQQQLIEAIAANDLADLQQSNVLLEQQMEEAQERIAQLQQQREDERQQMAALQ